MVNIIVSIDCETKGLDCTRFVYGCLIKDTGAKYYFKNKEDMWKFVINLGINEAKRGKILNVYAHNMQYDFHCIADFEDKHIVYFCMRPFIASYKLSAEECDQYNIKHQDGYGKEIIKFLDTFSIFKMSLQKLGVLIGLPKLEMPQELLNENTKVTDELIQEIIPYVTRDCEIVLESINFLKKKLKAEGIHIKRLYTINQIAIAYLINLLRNQDSDHIFWDKQLGQFRRVLRRHEIHSAYRGGRVECFHTGKFDNVTYIDCNSLYPYCSSIMRFPDLGSERKVDKPLDKFDSNELFNNIGVSRCLILNESNDLGLLPIRTSTGNFYAKKGTLLIGTWTHKEIKKSLNEGYKLIDVEWSVLFKEGSNPFKNITPKLFELRCKSHSPFDSYFYKMMMNCSYGKLAQTRVDQEIVMDSVEKAEEYIKNNYNIIKGVDLNYMYKKEKIQFTPKKYYAPIIPTLINAYARCFMYDMFKKIDINDIIYTDTDSIVFKGDYISKFDIGNDMGQFKIEHKNVPLLLYGKKTYSIGDEIKISGFNQKDLTLEEFEKGFVKSKQMVTINTTNDFSEAGKFKESMRDLKIQRKDFLKTEKLLKEQVLLRDNDVEDISYFLPKILKYTNK